MGMTNEPMTIEQARGIAQVAKETEDVPEIQKLAQDYIDLLNEHQSVCRRCLTAEAERDSLREQLTHTKSELDRVAQAVYPNKQDRFTYSVDFMIQEIQALREKLEQAKKNKENAMEAMTELPRWKCHKEVKEVWAFKITGIVYSDPPKDQENDGSAYLEHAEGYFQSVRVDHEYMRKHKPQVGGYFVQYKDGYRSFSPADAFEDGYTRVRNGPGY